MGWWIGSVASSLGNLQYPRGGKAHAILPMSSNALQMMGVTPISAGHDHLGLSRRGSGSRSRSRSRGKGGVGVGVGGGVISPLAGRSTRVISPLAGRSTRVISPLAGRSVRIISPLAGRSVRMQHRGSNLGLVHGSLPGNTQL